MNVPLNLRHVACFVAAAETGSMSAAAVRMQVSPSAISLSVAQLEGALEAQLFVRRRSLGLALTEAGRAFLVPARELLSHAEEVRANASAAGSEIAGRLVVGCFRAAAPFLLPELIETFAHVHPEVELDFIDDRMDAVIAALRDGRCEIAMAFDMGLDEDIARETIFETTHHVLLAPGHPLADLDEISLADLAEHQAIMLNVPHVEPSAPYIEQLFARAGHAVDVRYRTSNYELARALVARGFGFAMLLTRPAVDRSYEGLPLVTRPIADDLPRIRFALATLAGVRTTQRARAFAAHCRRLLATPQVMARLGATASPRGPQRPRARARPATPRPR
jgi:DNA-binding transcriptional LysR family regulator